MAVFDVIKGKLINLRPVEKADAAFIVELRSDTVLCAYINPVASDVEKQIAWIETQRARDGDYYFIIEKKDGTKLGTASVYDCTDRQAQFGRWICPHAHAEACESMLRGAEMCFDSLKKDCMYAKVDIRNIKTLKACSVFGFTYAGDAIETVGSFKQRRLEIRREAFDLVRDEREEAVDIWRKQKMGDRPA